MHARAAPGAAWARGCRPSCQAPGLPPARQGAAARHAQVRAGQSCAEAEGFLLSNPVSKTSMTSGLSELGKLQVVKQAFPALEALGACNGTCWIWPGIGQNSYQTAEVLGYLFGVGRNRRAVRPGWVVVVVGVCGWLVVVVVVCVCGGGGDACRACCTCLTQQRRLPMAWAKTLHCHRPQHITAPQVVPSAPGLCRSFRSWTCVAWGAWSAASCRR